MSPFILYHTIVSLLSGISSLMSLINNYYIRDKFDVEMALIVIYKHSDVAILFLRWFLV